MGRNRAAMPQLIDTYAFEERAAIREFDAGYGRAKAEWLARADVQAAQEANQRVRATMPATVVAPSAEVPRRGS